MDKKDTSKNGQNLESKTIAQLCTWKDEQMKAGMFGEAEHRAFCIAFFHAYDTYESRKEEESEITREEMEDILNIPPMNDRDYFSMMVMGDLSSYVIELRELIDRGLQAHLQTHTGSECIYCGQLVQLFEQSKEDYNPDVLEKAKSGNSLTLEESVSLESAIICAYGKVIEEKALKVVNYKEQYPKLHETSQTKHGELYRRNVTCSEVKP